ncbi:DUF2442 domain-containing protein [Deinococcus planocerae]|uniref:DUF2442 domain-containing protein n=1 Tax=Deinococcus planocerae TaxID=1737569 RepID=UPI000C7EC754|nr:DUF2442 domain-containing protein [Deinococcus planocerae]
MFAPLRSREVLEEVRVGPRGRTITWPGELDLDVDALRLPPERSGTWFRVLSRTLPGGEERPSSGALPRAVHPEE